MRVQAAGDTGTSDAAGDPAADVALDPATGKVKRYKISDGLQGYDFNHGAHFRSDGGRLFFGGVSGEHHTAAAVEAGRRLLAPAGRADATPAGPIPIGAAVHTGDAFVGSTTTDDVVSDCAKAVAEILD